MIILGLTGSIGMGKSTTAKLFKNHGLAVYSADKAVHDLYKSAPATTLVEAAFQGVVEAGIVNRQKLSHYVVGNPQNLKKLEAIIHPLVAKKQQDFIKKAKNRGEKIIVLDIPLLFETGGEAQVDKVVVVSAPLEIQRQRVMQRPEMSEAKFQSILANQIPDEEKCKRADYIIDTSKGIDAANAQVEALLAELSQQNHQ